VVSYAAPHDRRQRLAEGPTRPNARFRSTHCRTAHLAAADRERASTCTAEDSRSDNAGGGRYVFAVKSSYLEIQEENRDGRRKASPAGSSSIDPWPWAIRFVRSPASAFAVRADHPPPAHRFGAGDVFFCLKEQIPGRRILSLTVVLRGRLLRLFNAAPSWAEHDDRDADRAGGRAVRSSSRTRCGACRQDLPRHRRSRISAGLASTKKLPKDAKADATCARSAPRDGAQDEEARSGFGHEVRRGGPLKSCSIAPHAMRTTSSEPRMQDPVPQSWPRSLNGSAQGDSRRSRQQTRQARKQAAGASPRSAPKSKPEERSQKEIRMSKKRIPRSTPRTTETADREGAGYVPGRSNTLRQLNPGSLDKWADLQPIRRSSAR